MVWRSNRWRCRTRPTQAALEAYARGVNAWIGQVNRGALGRGAPEFFLFSNEIAAWQPADSIAILKLMALQLSGQLENEVLRARVSLVLPDARVRDILPDAPGTGVTALPDYSSLVPGVSPSLEPIRRMAGGLSPFPTARSGGGVECLGGGAGAVGGGRHVAGQ